MNMILDYFSGNSKTNFELKIEAGNNIEIISLLDDLKNVKSFEVFVSHKDYSNVMCSETIEASDINNDGSNITKVIFDLLNESSKLVS
jgi:nanoRNase/pAp phosphatase (c-di-AMP/oligoRNAs hydrolase)